MKSFHKIYFLDQWIKIWICPLLNSQLTSMTSLVRILKTALKLNNIAVLEEVANSSQSNTTLGMISHKKSLITIFGLKHFI